MPHVIVKLHAGRTDEMKKALADELTAAVQKVLGSKRESISIGVEDFDPASWAEQVNEPDLVAKAHTIVRPLGSA